MTAILSDSGSCPVCGRCVPRLVARQLGVPRELYACPLHGPVEYGPQPVTLAGWAQRLGGPPVPEKLVRALG